MGCDIHCYIEYKSKDSDQWSNFGGSINPGRNYWMFGFMAGVRLDVTPIVPPRGIPDDLGWSAADDYWYFITESGGSDGCCTLQQAEGWIKYGERLKKPEDGLVLHNSVSDPDAHTESWMTALEFEQAIASYLTKAGLQFHIPKLTAPEITTAWPEKGSEEHDALRWVQEYWAILAAMKCFEAQGLDSRLVFWFDN